MAHRDEAAQAKPAANAPQSPAEEFSFFEYYCLTKLGRDADARTKLTQFRKEFKPVFGRANLPMQGFSLGGRNVEQWEKDLTDPNNLSGQLLRDLYEAEVFLSLDAATDGESFFRQDLEAAQTDVERLSHAVVLEQFLLLQKKRREYAELTAKTVTPLLVKMWDPDALEKIKTTVDLERVEQLVLMGVGGITLIPMLDPDFLKGVPDDALAACVPDLKTLAAKAKDDLTQQGCHWVLFAVVRKLGLENEKQAAVKVLKGHEGDFDEKKFDEGMRELIAKGRELLRGLTARQ
jgi:hypothetical protein